MGMLWPPGAGRAGDMAAAHPATNPKLCVGTRLYQLEPSTNSPSRSCESLW